MSDNPEAHGKMATIVHVPIVKKYVQITLKSSNNQG